MKKITTLLCGIAMAAALSSPVHAGGKSTTGASTTPNPAAIVAVFSNRVTGMRAELLSDGRADLFGRSGQRIGGGTLSSAAVSSLLSTYGWSK